MRLSMIVAVSCLALAGCEQKAEAPPADANADANVAMEADVNVAAPAATATLNETTWEWTDPETKKVVVGSIDAKGAYIINEKDGGKHVDHGTAVMKDGKTCFTSAMTKGGEECWKDAVLAEGQSGETVSDKGEKLAIKRVAYTPLTM